MPEYDWTCKACDKKVLASKSACNHCGCPASAIGQVVEKYKDPKALIARKAKENIEITVIIFTYLPVLTLILLTKAGIVGLVAIIGLVAMLVKNNRIIKIIMTDSWGRVVYPGFGVLTFLMLISGNFFGPNYGDDLFPVSVLILVAWMISGFYYLLLSKKSKILLSDVTERQDR